MRPKGSAEELERRRLRALSLLEEGHSQTKVGQMVGASQASVSRWQKAAAENGGTVPAKPHPGRTRLLTDDQHRRLEKLLVKGASALGWSNDLWTCPRVRQLILDQFDVDYHVDHVRKILVYRLGWTSQRPERRARERDDDEVEHWRNEELPRLKKTLNDEEQRSFSSTNQASCSLPSYVEPSRLAGKHRFTAAGIAAIVSPPSAPSR